MVGGSWFAFGSNQNTWWYGAEGSLGRNKSPGESMLCSQELLCSVSRNKKNSFTKCSKTDWTRLPPIIWTKIEAIAKSGASLALWMSWRQDWRFMYSTNKSESFFGHLAALQIRQIWINHIHFPVPETLRWGWNDFCISFDHIIWVNYNHTDNTITIGIK